MKFTIFLEFLIKKYILYTLTFFVVDNFPNTSKWKKIEKSSFHRHSHWHALTFRKDKLVLNYKWLRERAGTWVIQQLFRICIFFCVCVCICILSVFLFGSNISFWFATSVLVCFGFVCTNWHTLYVQNVSLVKIKRARPETSNQWFDLFLHHRQTLGSLNFFQTALPFPKRGPNSTRWE